MANSNDGAEGLGFVALEGAALVVIEIAEGKRRKRRRRRKFLKKVMTSKS